MSKCRSQWQRGLRRGSAAARLLRSWVRIPPGAWMFFCCECYVLSGGGLCDGLITRPEESYRLRCVVVCDPERPREWWGGYLLECETASWRPTKLWLTLYDGIYSWNVVTRQAKFLRAIEQNDSYILHTKSCVCEWWGLFSFGVDNAGHRGFGVMRRR